MTCSDLQGPSKAHWTPQEVRGFTGRETLSPAKLIFRVMLAIKKKRELFPGLTPTSPRSFALQLVPASCSGSGILTRFPFDRRSMIGRFVMEFPYLLRSTNPCPTAVHIEPFSTSVFKVLI